METDVFLVDPQGFLIGVNREIRAKKDWGTQAGLKL